MGYRIQIIIGKDHSRRGVAFLISSDDKKVNAYDFYDRLDKENVIRRMFNTRFDNWQEGQLPKKHRYHGWNKSEFKGSYTQCFVFKYKEHRLYGFLCNPKTPRNPNYQICVLTRYTTKNEHESDETDLKYVEEIRTNISVQQKVKDFFKEKP
jgi:hypothetical protein